MMRRRRTNDDEGKVDEEELPFHIYNTPRLLGVQRLVANRPPAKAAAVTVQKVSVQYTRLLTRHPSNSTVDGGLVSKRERERETHRSYKPSCRQVGRPFGDDGLHLESWQANEMQTTTATTYRTLL